ncbi:MAG: 3-hexulose-6-phosphate synthase [Candidatus Humimicrobiaceae bacterium]
MLTERINEDKKKYPKAMLQLALDTIDLNMAKVVLHEVIDYIDIVEIGTPFIIRYGIKVVEEIKSIFPCLPLLADLKIADAGEYESQMAFKSGADIVTVLAAAEDSTIRAAVKQAVKSNKSVMIDMIGINDIEKRTSEIDKMGVNYICAHLGFDEQNKGKNPLKDLIKVKNNTQNAKIAVAGGINLLNLNNILDENPDIVIIGSGITSEVDRKGIAIKIKKKIINQRRDV